MRRHARAQFDLAALRHNLGRVRAAAPGARVMAAVKADAYGHGMLRVAEALAAGGAGEAADGLAVACVDEALALREAGIRLPVLALQGPRDVDELRAAADRGITLCLHQAWQCALLDAVRLPQPVAVWLKIDTGMHRMGVAMEEVAGLHQALSAHANVAGPPGLMTHFARADEPGSPVTDEQIAAFDRATGGLAGPQSLANSAAILSRPDSHRDWVRPGIMLYGGSPFADTPAADLGLRPVMTLTAPLIAIRQARRGDAIGYGGDWTCPEDMPIGCVAIGYGDGYPRHAPSGTPVAVAGRRTALAGRVSMDVVTIDLRGIDARVGDPVELWGPTIPMDEVATHAGTISYELTCSTGPFV